ncbi:MAG: Fusaric acid resistance protein-like-domain-containing protein [Olpidium bornovanus]|uniref:Fusaric acid resistance protein-like-domain-containing protein n=1 Tax=Olpidium bornovanus TaxID=278681 RepID=A0A8H7ZX10_9FUNG|nr:MAG: Fusaric acid resistance protein-like-domain-containing protein [Olpidium bornovanus]
MDPDVLIHPRPMYAGAARANGLREPGSEPSSVLADPITALPKESQTDHAVNAGSLEKAIETHRAAFRKLEQSLEEASREFYFLRTWSHLSSYSQLVTHISRLTQHLGGMTSGVELTVELLKLAEATRSSTDEDAVETLLDFSDHTGPPMRALAYTCKQVLILLESSLSSEDEPTELERVPLLARRRSSEIVGLRQALQSALQVFSDARKKGVVDLYKRSGGRMNQSVFLVYCEHHEEDSTRVVVGFNEELLKQAARLPVFVFSLQEFSRELADGVVFSMSLRQLKFPFKTATVLTVMAAPAFFEPARTAFANYRGEWALITTAVISSPTVGASNLTSLYRLLATFAGAMAAYLTHVVTGGHPGAVACVLFLISVPCFDLILHSAYPKIGQFGLLACTTVALQVYRSDAEQDVLDLAWKRFMMVSVGIVCGLFVTWYWWPFEARFALRMGIAELLERMSHVYLSLVAAFSVPGQSPPQPMYIKREHSLQRRHDKLNELLTQA